ncbi:hypothetical protein OROGR_009043 [Orobanche gracilis]
MNPYVEKQFEARLKRINWKEGDEGKTWLELMQEELEMGNKKREWYMNRKYEIRGTNNPWISEIEVMVSHGFKFILHPRVKLVYDFISFAPHDFGVNPAIYSLFIRDKFASYRTVKPIYVDLFDIHLRKLSGNPSVQYEDLKRRKRKAKIVAEVGIYFRNLSFLDPPKNHPDDFYSKIEVAREFLLNHKVSRFRLRLNCHDFELKAKVPLSEDPYAMLAQFQAANPGYVERARPLIIIHNLASKWFFQPNSFEPTKELLTAFLSVFGPIRYLDVSKDQLNGELCTASVQYFVHDDFINALKILCCCSLRQEHSPELVDYEVTLGPAPCEIALAIHPVEQEKIVTRMRKLKICEDQDTLIFNINEIE